MISFCRIYRICKFDYGHELHKFGNLWEPCLGKNVSLAEIIGKLLWWVVAGFVHFPMHNICFMMQCLMMWWWSVETLPFADLFW